ncbi:hypothetical protein CYMTET_20641, partial [Cymbomonas tetramitiformis]
MLGELSAETPHVGGGGHAMYADLERNDLVSWLWVDPPQGNFTLEFWIFIYNDFQEATVASYSTYNSTTRREQANELCLLFSKNFVRFFRRTSRMTCETSSCTSIATGREWNHFAVVSSVSEDRSQGSLLMYVNGIKQLEETVGQHLQDFLQPLEASGAFIIGQEQDAFIGGFDELQSLDGMLDEYRIWGVARSEYEISQTYRLTLVGTNYAGLLALLRFEETATNLAGTEILQQELIQQVLWGSLPDLRNEMWYTSGRGTQTPTAPRLVASQAPLFGAEIMVVVRAGETVQVVLRGMDPQGGNLSTSIGSLLESVSVLGTGTLSSLDGVQLAAGDAVIDDQGDRAGPRVQYTAPSWEGTEGVADWRTHFTYLVENEDGEEAEGKVVVRAMLRSLPSKEVYFQEDEISHIILGSIGEDGAALVPIITSLPDKGNLYQAKFNNDRPQPFSYASPNPSAFNLTIPLTEEDLPLEVENERGVMIYWPPADESSTASPLTTFRYKARYSSGTVSEESTVSIWVEPQNDPPKSEDQFIMIDGQNLTTVYLTSNDIDPTFAPHNYHLITQWPERSTIFQEDGEEMSQDAITSITVQY